MLLAMRDFLPINRHCGGCIDTEPYLMAVDGDDSDLDVISDLKDFANIARQGST